MGTATSRGAAALAGAGLCLLLGACGGHGATGRQVSSSSSSSAGGATSPSAGAFDWLRPGPPPAGWPVAAIPSGATMPYPPGWTPIHGDPGTASAALLGGGQRYLGYLNLTPRQGAETLAGWARFRVEHNAEEGDRHVTTLATATGRPFVAGTGSCVQDTYTTSVGTSYREIACLVQGHRTTVVIVGAGPPQAWPRVAPMIERAISSVTS